MVAGSAFKFGSPPFSNLTCHVNSSVLSLSLEQEAKASETGPADRWYKTEYELFNYFTEISFYLENAILLQMIQIIHMTDIQFDR